jgi:hypothetical protein
MDLVVDAGLQRGCFLDEHGVPGPGGAGVDRAVLVEER